MSTLTKQSKDLFVSARKRALYRGVKNAAIIRSHLRKGTNETTESCARTRKKTRSEQREIRRPRTISSDLDANSIAISRITGRITEDQREEVATTEGLTITTSALKTVSHIIRTLRSNNSASRSTILTLRSRRSN